MGRDGRRHGRHAASVLTLMASLRGASPLGWRTHASYRCSTQYGYVPAIITGFLLTAVPNWTGRLPVVGARLLLLAGGSFQALRGTGWSGKDPAVCRAHLVASINLLW